MANELQVITPDQFRAQINKMQPEFRAVLPPSVTPERFARVCITAIQNNPKILEATPRSILAACMKAAEDGLLPDGRQGAIVVFGEDDEDNKGKGKKKKKIASWLPMIAGIRKKILECDEIRDFQAEIVYEGDVFEYEKGDDPRLVHKPMMGTTSRLRQPIYVYTIARFMDGYISRDVMAWDEIIEIRNRFVRAKRGPWYDPMTIGEMAKKTVAKRHAKTLPTSDGLDQVFARDNDHYALAREDTRQLPASSPAQTQRSIGSALDSFAEDDPDGEEGTIEGTVGAKDDQHSADGQASDVQAGSTGAVGQQTRSERHDGVNFDTGAEANQRKEETAEDHQKAGLPVEEAVAWIRAQTQPIDADTYVKFFRDIAGMAKAASEMEAVIRHWRDTQTQRATYGVPVETANSLFGKIQEKYNKLAAKAPSDNAQS